MRNGLKSIANSETYFHNWWNTLPVKIKVKWSKHLLRLPLPQSHNLTLQRYSPRFVLLTTSWVYLLFVIFTIIQDKRRNPKLFFLHYKTRSKHEIDRWRTSYAQFNLLRMHSLSKKAKRIGLLICVHRQLPSTLENRRGLSFSFSIVNKHRTSPICDLFFPSSLD